MDLGGLFEWKFLLRMAASGAQGANHRDGYRTMFAKPRQCIVTHGASYGLLGGLSRRTLLYNFRSQV